MTVHLVPYLIFTSNLVPEVLVYKNAPIHQKKPPLNIVLYYPHTGICYEPVCAGRIDGTYQDTTHACRRAYVCKGGRLDTIDNCPYGKLHNGHICEAQDNVFCELPQTTAIAYPYSGDKRCAGLKDGAHISENTNCNRFIVCKSAEVISDIECAENYRFHDGQRQCVPQNQVTICGNNNGELCKGLRNGLHADPASIDCRAFIKCQNGEFISRDYCGTQAVFNGSTCVPAPLYQCSNSPNTPDICRKKSNGLIGDPRKGCRSYVRCMSGRTIDQLECPPANYFDSHLSTCVVERNEADWKCRIGNLQSSDCLQLETGYYQDKSIESACRNYFHCFNGKRTDFKCPRGMVFDGEFCVKSELYICPNQNSNSCANRPNGYYKDERAGCRAYFYCSGSNKFRYLCGEQQYFNGTMCVQRHVGHTCQNMDACSGKTDGYYPDLNSRCRKYYFCLKEEVLTTITCHGSKIYNGHKCVTTDMYTCPSPNRNDEVNCIPRSSCQSGDCEKNGFYADIDSGCVKYHFCIGNKKSVLFCKDGFLFNGEVCVPGHQYTCPKYCRDSNSDKCER